MGDTEYPNQARSYLTDEEMKRLDDWRRDHGRMSRSSAIRHILTVGMDELERQEELARMEELRKPYRMIQDVPQA